MKDAHALYLELLGINRDAFAIDFFLAAYYCLEKSAHLAVEMGDKSKLVEVERLVVQQLSEMKSLLKEPPELVLYKSLACLVSVQRTLPQYN